MARFHGAFVSLLFLLLLTSPGTLAQDPCGTAQPWTVGLERDPSHITGSLPVCDTFSENWYRVTGPGETELDIAQVAPVRGRCGTQFPMWLNGTLPSDGSSAKVDICVVGLTGECSERLVIDVKHCGFFRAYKLKPASVCPAAYCFDMTVPTTPVPDPTCPSNLVTIAGHPRVLPLVRDSDDPALSMPSLVLEELQFACSFTNPNDELFYDVKWFINGFKLAYERRAVPGHDLASTVLREQHWRQKFKLGMQVACSVAVRTHPNCSPGTERRSDDFFAGIRVSPTVLNMEETDPPKNLSYICTVPIPCFHDHGQPSENCELHLNASGRSYSHGCPVDDQVSPVQTPCGVTFQSRKWQDVKKLEVSATYDDSFDDGSSLVSVKANGRWPDNNIPDIWKDVVVPPVTVNVRDRDKKFLTRNCKVWDDPYYTTFDGMFYKSTLAGEFEVFRHKDFPVAVHAIHKRCPGISSITCVCGVAVQSGQEVIIWNGCGNMRGSRSFGIRSFGCYKRGIKVEEIVDGRIYQIQLPIGARVVLTRVSRLGWQWINIDIKPTPDLRNMVDGLCGNMDGILSNDPNTAQKQATYRVPAGKSLFRNSLRKDWTYMSVCVCYTSSDHITGDTTRRVVCNNRKTAASCLPSMKDVTEIYTETCRQKRDLSLHDLDEDWPGLASEESQDPPFAGNTSFTSVTLEAYKSDCQDQVSRNSSLWTSVPGQPSVFDSIMELMCTDNCNDRGTCVQGVCHCNSGYIGADCGVDVRKPPKDIFVPQFGLCDLNQHLCQGSFIFGTGFFDFGNFGYRANVIQVSRYSISGTKIMKTGTGVVHSRNEARLIFDPISTISGVKDLDTPSVIGYQITVTNNGHDYGGEAIFLPYDSTCFSCIATESLTSCEIKTGYCSIDFRCVVAGEMHPENPCYVCQPDISTVSWSLKGCPDDHHRSLIIGLVVPCLILIAAVLVVLVLKKSGLVSKKVGLPEKKEKNFQEPPPPYSRQNFVNRPTAPMVNSWVGS